MGRHEISAFLLGFPALFSIVNPLTGAFIFFEFAETRQIQRREHLAALVAFYSLCVLIVSIWAGSYILSFFGITLAALRLAGGVVVAANAWFLLSAPGQREEHKQQQIDLAGQDGEDIAFFPLTIPFTAGPGTISVAITLGAERPHLWGGAAEFLLGLTAAAAAVAALIWIFYLLSGEVDRFLGHSGRRIVTRLFAFLLLCIGVQIMISGLQELAPTMRWAGS